jgi:DNA-binding LytR/AlgR family response regulator
VSRKDAASEPPPAGLFWPAWAAFAVVVLLIDLLDVQAAWREGLAHNPWEPVIWEYTSGTAHIALYPLIWRAARLAYPGDGRPLRLVLTHAMASLAYSLAHIAGFIALRDVIYALAGARYHFDGLRGVLYEYPRDLVAYFLVAAGLWGLSRLLNARAPAASLPPLVRDGAATFDIRDGPRTLRVPISQIAAVSSAGNYVEFNLVDCRKPLMRATLGAIESEFAPKGFVRIHRSWLVNAARVEAIEPAGSGDFTVTLAGGVKAPLSRRFREALEALRGADA